MGRWFVVWNSFNPVWKISKYEVNYDIDFEICLGCLQFCRWRKEEKEEN